ncbi:MAG: TolC family protein [Planctomycetota bacterium]|jgi:outer membrane protein TolC
MQRFSTVLITLSLILIAGCVSQRAFDREMDQVRAEAYDTWLTQREVKERRGRDSEAHLSGTLLLNDALMLAFRNNRSIQAIMLERVKAKGQVWQAWSAVMPTAALKGNFKRLDDEQFAPANESDTYSAELTVTQPLFKGGAIRASLRRVPIVRALADEQIRSTAQTVFYNVTKAYYDALLARRLTLVNRAALDSAAAQLRDVNAKVDQGEATRFDVLRAEVDVANFRSNMIRERNRAELAEASLLHLLGASQESKIKLAEELNYVAMKPVFKRAVEMAHKNRSDLRLAELSIRQQEEVLRIAKSAYYPQLSLFVSRLFSNPHPHYASVSKPDDWGDTHTVGVTMNMSLFDGLSREGKVSEARATLKQQNINLLDAQEKALLELRTAMLSLNNAEELVESQKKNEERASEGLRLAEVGYKEGVNTEVEVVDARKALTEARGNYYEAIYAHALSRLDLQRAMGVLAPKPADRTSLAKLTKLPVKPARILEFEDKK